MSLEIFICEYKISCILKRRKLSDPDNCRLVTFPIQNISNYKSTGNLRDLNIESLFDLLAIIFCHTLHTRRPVAYLKQCLKHSQVD